MRFYSDFSIFPDVLNKSDAYRIFMNLAFAHESTLHLGTETSAFSQARDSSKMSLIGSKRASL